METIYKVKGSKSDTRFKKKHNIHNNKQKNYQKPAKNNCLNKKYLYIILIIVFACSLIICLSVLLTLNKKIKTEVKINESNFAINTEINQLSQYLMKSSQVHHSLSNSDNSTLSIFQIAKYDIYTLNESLPEKEIDFLSKIYTTAIIVNSQCYEFKNNKNNCELKKYLDLTIKNKNNLRRINENIEEIKQAILPICLIEHSNTNIIFSVACPETLSANLKSNIISAFQSIKPNLIKENYQNYNLSGLTFNITNNEANINLFDKRCEQQNKNENQSCSIIRNITADRMGNLEKSNKLTTFKKIKDNKNKYYNNINCTFENISNKNNEFEDNFKYNLNLVLELIKPLMKKEIYMTLDILNNSTKDKSNYSKFRKLEDDNLNYSGFKEQKFFSKSLFGINMELNIKNEFGLDKGQNSKAISNLIRGEKTDEISKDETFTNLYEIMNNFISLSKAGNKMANLLFLKFNETFSNFKNDIISNITVLNNLLVFKDLSSIFDSTLAIDNLEVLPNSIIISSQNLYSNISNLNKSLEKSIINIKIKLKDNIQTFINISQNLLDNIINNLTGFNEILVSNKSKVTEISTYYLQYKDSKYEDIIKKAKLILENYNIKEKNLIDFLLNNIFIDFSNNFTESIHKIQSLLDNIINKLKNRVINIKSGKNNDISHVINNLSNTKILINQIKSNIPLILNNSIGIKENGYFESKEELERNKKRYEEIIDKGINISYILDNNIFIDTTFDSIMEDFKNQFVSLLIYIEKTKKEKFPLKNNMFLNSSFILDLFIKMEEDFKNKKLKILNYIIDENNYYLDSIEKQTKYFIHKYKEFLDNLINDMDSQLSEINLFNIDSKYNEMLNVTFTSINDLIQNNNNLATQYLTNVKNSGSSHCTQLFKNKAKIFFDSFTNIKNYIQLNLKNNLIYKYNNSLNEIKNNLEIIKFNSVIKKYKNNTLPFTENHLKIIDILMLRLEKYLSSELFNEKYLSIIDNYINSTLEYLIQIETNLNNLYNPVTNLPYSSSNSYDYYLLRVYCYKVCSRKILGKCIDHKTECINYYDGYSVGGSNNYLNLISIDFDEYNKNLDSYFNGINAKISNDSLSYKNTLNIYQNNLELIKNGILEKTPNYLYNISERINYFINKELCHNLTMLSYNYFKEEIKNKLNFELDYILSKLKKEFNKLISNVNLNIDNFKYSIQELGIIAQQYYEIYYLNLFSDFSNSIIEQRKNDFNYTLKYYHNMILSKVNKTYNYILNNMPINEEVFNDILNIRNDEIQASYYNMINSINNTKYKYLQIQEQLNIIGVNESDFFFINSNLLKKNEYSKNQLILKCEELLKTLKKVKKENTDESILSRFYLENIQNEKQIKEIYAPVNREEFIDLQSNIYKELISEIVEIDRDNILKNIKKTLIDLNELVIKNLKIEKDKYENILQNKIYKEFFTKEDLENNITNLYENGLNNIDTNSKNLIYKYLNEIINKIKSEISSEIARLSNDMTSYSNNYLKIEKNINDLKNLISERFYSTIFSVNNEFYSKIVNIFYKEYIEKYLNEYQNIVQIERFKEYKFLNISINLKNILNESIIKLVNEYKNYTMEYINFMNEKYLQQFDKIFSFSDFKNRINNEINNIYNYELLPILKEKAIYDSGDKNVLDYNLSNTILSDINSFIDEKIDKTNKIINKLKGNNFNFIKYWKKPEFSLVQKEELLYIKNSFNNFTRIYNEKEKEEFNNLILENLTKNIRIIIENFIPSFGKDYFDKIIKYNEIQKIKSLFNNLKYSLLQTINYYIKLFSLYPSITIPEDLKEKVQSLNKIDQLINSFYNEDILKLNKKLNKIFDETKDYIVDKYIYYIKADPSIQLELDNNIKTILENILDNNREIFENEYYNIINIYIKNSFVSQYKQILNEESNKIINFIEENKNIINEKFKKFNIIKIDNILLTIENKLNNTINAIDNYNIYFKSFQISKDIPKLLNNYCKETILPYYEEIKLNLDISTKDIIVKNLDTNIKYLKNNYITSNFISKSKNISKSFQNSYFKNMLNYLDYTYGSIESEYLLNLNKEIINYKNLRNLEDSNNGININKQNIADITIDEIFKLLKSSLFQFLEFFNNYNVFSEFEQKINKYKDEINEQYIFSKNNIQKMKYEESINQKLNQTLYNISKFIIDYYEKTNSSYYQTKEYIHNSFNIINDLIEKCGKITFEQINNKYLEIKNNFNPINNKIDKEKMLSIEKHNEIVDGMNYIIDAKVDKYFIENEIILDIILEEGDIIIPKVIGKIINKNRPKKCVIDFYSNYGQFCEIKGRKITINFNNISLISDFIFDIRLNNITINNTIDFDEYNIKNEKYTIKEENFLKVLGGITFTIPNLCTSTIDGENEIENINEFKNSTIEIINY